jgi:hypothetical protein
MTQEQLIQKLHMVPSWQLQHLIDVEAEFIRRLENDKEAISRHEPLFSLAKRELSIRGELQLPDCRDDGEEWKLE